MREKPTRADTNDFRAKGLKDVDLFDGDIVRHDDTALVAPTERSTYQWTSPERDLAHEWSTYFARPTVAMDIPVDPTVPSNILHPVCGTRSPASSASSMTVKGKIFSDKSEREKAFRLTFQCNSVLY
jgi:hypothetical protein